MRKSFLRTALVFVIAAGMVFSTTGISARAVQHSNLNNFHYAEVQSVYSGKRANNTDNQRLNSHKSISQKSIMSERRNGIKVASIAVYPATDIYYESICDMEDYTNSSYSPNFLSYHFTQDVKNNLIAKFKAKTNTVPTGWEVKVTLYITTEKDYPASLYLKLNKKELKDYSIYVSNGNIETIPYYTTTDESWLGGYIEYSDGSTEVVNTGTDAPESKQKELAR